MMNLLIPEDENILFEAILETDELDLETTKGGDNSEGVIKTFISKENKVAVGLPYFENLTPQLQNLENPSSEIKSRIENNDFHFISLSCSFLPDSDCRFRWARFEVDLFSLSSSQQPLVWDIFPAEVTTEIKQTSEITISPELTFKVGEVEAGSKLFTIKSQREFLTYEPQIFSFGFRRKNVAWDFKSTVEKGIWGDKRNLCLLVMTPKNSKLKGRFRLSAQVETQKTSFKLSLSKREDNIVNKLYTLSS